MFSYFGDRFLAIRPVLRIPVEKIGWLNKDIGRSIGALLARGLLLYDSMIDKVLVIYEMVAGQEAITPKCHSLGILEITFLFAIILSPIYYHLRYVYFKSVYRIQVSCKKIS